jgi:hypothetical protein
MSTTREPRFGSKQSRQDADLLKAAGFVYAGLRSDGHHTYAHPDGYEHTFAETPGPWQHKAIVDMLRKRYGHGQRGKFDPAAAKARARATAELEAHKARIAQTQRDRYDGIRRDQLEAKAEARRRARRRSELGSVAHLMGMSGYSASLVDG